MKSRTLYSCLAVVLSVSTLALGEIVDDGDWWGGDYGLGIVSGNEFSTAAYGIASGDDTDGAAYGSGWHHVWTTERVQCEYEYYLHTWGEANIYDYDYGYCRSHAVAEVNVEGENAHPDPEKNHYQDSYVSDAYVDEQSNPKSDYDGPYGVYEYNEEDLWHDPGDGIKTDHEVLAYGVVASGSDAWAISHADGRTFCDLHQTYP